ncbi:unnamed protein product [Prunus armeniaca]|uniref:Uncharacterized protein n=1 Tax=Prunus armeniaca TaxID=36596 RepID=A0A6J5V9G1_PRUAR|nr:unnamed protein product [Prunus armeniaca]
MSSVNSLCGKGRMVLTIFRDTALTLASALYVKETIMEKFGNNGGSGSSVSKRFFGKRTEASSS